MGRSSEFTQDLADTICERVADGKSLRQIERADDMPTMRTILRWLAQQPAFLIQYQEACAAREQHLFDELREIADDGSNDYVERTRPDGTKFTVFDNEHVQRSRLRVDTIKWQLARMSPKKYGDRVVTEHVGEGGGPVQVDVRSRDPLWLDGAFRLVLANAGLKLVPLNAQVILPSPVQQIEGSRAA